MTNEELTTYLYRFVKKLRLYHRHKVVGLEHIPRTGRALLVFNHSLATYDIGMLFDAVKEELKRMPRPLADHLFFKLPFLGELAEAIGATEGSPDNAQRLLMEDQLVAVAPGGMKEAIRPSDRRYQLDWSSRKGFVRLAIKTSSPIILCLCPKADDLYDVYPSKLTEMAYQYLRIPLILARGLGPSVLPRPIRLVHFISEPIIPPAPSASEKIFASQVDKLHKKVLLTAEELIGKAIAYKES